MAKIDGKYEESWTEDLLKRIVLQEDSITKRHHLIQKYLHFRSLQIEKIIANLDDDEIDLAMVVEQLWEDLRLAKKQLLYTTSRVDFYAKYYGIKD